jgi:hypothetical protein
VSPLKCGGQYLLPASPTCEKLGTQLEYDQDAQSLVLTNEDGVFTLPLNTLHGDVDGKPFILQYPPVLYENKAFVPLPLLKKITGARSEKDKETHTLRLYTPYWVAPTQPIEHLPEEPLNSEEMVAELLSAPGMKL